MKQDSIDHVSLLACDHPYRFPNPYFENESSPHVETILGWTKPFMPHNMPTHDRIRSNSWLLSSEEPIFVMNIPIVIKSYHDS
jgi:hypothetical protein